MTLGTKLRNYRNKKGISLEKLAIELNISKAAIGKGESDKSIPNSENLLKIADCFETDVYELLKNVENVNFGNAKFKGNQYVVNPNNSTINYSTPPELIESIVDNQNKITVLMELQNELLVSLLAKKT
ncbi:helix-turn-helix transcriptional regulator [Flavobacterium sp. j3]|uniref:Helix-turn-helix transcriptional regulator n=1 Tax=Flavobacterium aureirubrum TaxID=3133147 RepID=A0ABU9N6M1_9FLAO